MKNIIGFTLLATLCGMSCYFMHVGTVEDVAAELVKGGWH